MKNEWMKKWSQTLSDEDMNEWMKKWNETQLEFKNEDHEWMKKCQVLRLGPVDKKP